MNNNTKLLLLFCFVNLSNVFDVTSTIYSLSNGGQEVNIFYLLFKNLFAWTVESFLIFKLLIVLAWTNYTRRRLDFEFNLILFLGLSIFYLFAGFINFYGLKI